MTRTYYEVLNADGQPATKRQQKLLGTPEYGYATLVLAELACPKGCIVCARYANATEDWSGPIVSVRLPDGWLERLLPFEGI